MSYRFLLIAGAGAGWRGSAEIEGDGGDSVRSQGVMARLQLLLPPNTAASFA